LTILADRIAADFHVAADAPEILAALRLWFCWSVRATP
jgi:hypothetical protein